MAMERTATVGAGAGAGEGVGDGVDGAGDVPQPTIGSNAISERPKTCATRFMCPLLAYPERPGILAARTAVAAQPRVGIDARPYRLQSAVVVISVFRARVSTARAARAAALSFRNRPNTVEPLPVIAACDAPALRSALTMRPIWGCLAVTASSRSLRISFVSFVPSFVSLARFRSASHQPNAS